MLSNFKQFNESNLNFMSEDDVKDIFIDIIDEGFDVEFFRVDPNTNCEYSGKYFFEFRKNLSNESLGYIDVGNVTGYTNLSNMKSQLDIFDILIDIKTRLNSLGYTISFGYESSLTPTSDNHVILICNMQHSKFDSDSFE